MIFTDPYNPLSHLYAIKNLFHSSKASNEIVKESNVVEKTETITNEKQVQCDDHASVLQDLAKLITDYDVYATQFTDNTTLSLVKHLQDSVMELMIKHGAEEFFETQYHCLSDVVVPFRIIEENTTISCTIRPGLKYNNKVLLRSQVKIDG